MNPKKYLYAAVGAQVAAAKTAQTKLDELMAKMNRNATSASSDLKGRIDTWAGEGEKFIAEVTDTKAIDELTSKVDFDQMQTQVHKLRDQLEDIVSTWRANFRPESKPAETVTVTEKPEETKAEEAPKSTATKAPAAKSTATKSTATKAASTKAATTKKPAAKSTTAKSPAKKPAAKSTTTKSTTAKKQATQKAS